MPNNSNASNRILSIDVFRGLTMFLLIGEFTGLYSLLSHETLDGSFLGAIGHQLHHHPWNGLRFWDLIQPFFMFIVGLSLPFAVKNRVKRGESSKQIFNHVLKRSLILLLLGWGLYCIGPGKITFRFQNVLAQIAFTYLIAYLIMHRSVNFQLIFSLVLLAITEILYRTFPVEGFNHAFVASENFGTWLDLQYGGADLGGSWVSFNAIPTAAHTIWGVLVGKLLMSDQSSTTKLKRLLIAGGILVIVGYLLNPITPIIKRISTSSFVFVSGGWSILVMAFLYWIVDMRKMDGRWTLFFSVVGMNSLFIYLFAHLDGAQFIEKILHPFSYALFGLGGEFIDPNHYCAAGLGSPLGHLLLDVQKKVVYQDINGAMDKLMEPFKKYADLFIRLPIGFHLIYGTQDNIFSWDRMLEFSEFLANFGVPMSLVAAHVSVYAQFICGILFIIGWKLRWAALVMIINFIMAIFLVHIGDSYPNTFPAIMMLSGSIFLLLSGAGPISISSYKKG